MITISPKDTKSERIWKGAALLESEKNAHKKTALKLDTAAKLLDTFLTEFERKWDETEECDSEKAGLDYLDAAEWMRDYFGRKDHRIVEVEKWVYDYLPLHQTIKP